MNGCLVWAEGGKENNNPGDSYRTAPGFTSEFKSFMGPREQCYCRLFLQWGEDIPNVRS